LDDLQRQPGLPDHHHIHVRQPGYGSTAPSWYDVHPTSSSSIYAQFSGNGDGGAAIDIWQIGYGTDPNYPQYYVDTYAYDIGGLNNAYTWYFWGRGHNSQGWGNWSSRISAVPFRVPDPPTVVTLTQSDKQQDSHPFTGNWDGGTPVRQLADRVWHRSEHAAVILASNAQQLKSTSRA
jgi:hypothetical protein